MSSIYFIKGYVISEICGDRIVWAFEVVVSLGDYGLVYNT